MDDMRKVRTCISKKQSLPSELQDRLPFAMTNYIQNSFKEAVLVLTICCERSEKEGEYVEHLGIIG